MQNIYNIVIFIGIFALMYFFVIRPQNKRNKELKLLQESLKVVDKVVTFAGIYGEIVEIGTSTVILKISQKTEIKLERVAIRGLAS